MRSAVRSLLRYRRNRYLSQAGEAGILEEVLRRLGIRHGVMVEAGACDGLFLSNTNQFVGHGHRLVYVESNPVEFGRLVDNFAGTEDVLTIQRHIAPTGADSLDAVLTEAGVPAEFDLLVLDLDSYDLAVFRAMTRVPKVVMLEYNPFFFPDENYEADTGALNPSRGGKGSSLGAIYQAALAKGYEIVCTLNMNAVFVRADLRHLVVDRPVSRDDSATYEFLPLGKLTLRQMAQRAYYLGAARVLHALAIRAGLVKTFEYPPRGNS